MSGAQNGTNVAAAASDKAKTNHDKARSRAGRELGDD
jgi:hypothetical protein